jgi:hypothetical protein
MYLYTFRQTQPMLLYKLYIIVQTTTCFGLYGPSSGCVEP